jgi:hypothetical protein
LVRSSCDTLYTSSTNTSACYSGISNSCGSRILKTRGATLAFAWWNGGKTTDLSQYGMSQGQHLNLESSTYGGATNLAMRFAVFIVE